MALTAHTQDIRPHERDFLAGDLVRRRTARLARGRSGDGRFYDFLALQMSLTETCNPAASRSYHGLLEEYVRTGTIAATPPVEATR